MLKLNRTNKMEIIGLCFSLDNTLSLNNLRKSYNHDHELTKDPVSFSDLYSMINNLDSYRVISNNPVVGNTGDYYNNENIFGKGYNCNAEITNHAFKENEEIQRFRERYKGIVSKITNNAQVNTSDETNDIFHNSATNEYSPKKQLDRYQPTEDMSIYYKITYLKTVLSIWLDNHEFDKDDDLLRSQIYDCLIDANMFPFRYFFRRILDEKKKISKISLAYQIRNNLHDIIEKNEFSANTLELLKFYLQIFLSIIMIESISNGIDPIQFIHEALAYIYYFIAAEYKNVEPSIGLKFSKRSLNISDNEFRCRAFNTLAGLALITGGHLQLAYDALYSWINRTVVGEIKQLYTLNHLYDEEEINWRLNKGKFEETLMHVGLASVCAAIGDTYEATAKSQKRRQEFYQIAKNEITEAISLYPKYPPLHRIFGNILNQNPDIVNIPVILEHYITAINIAKKTAGYQYEAINAFYYYYRTVIDYLTKSFSNFVNRKERGEKAFPVWKAIIEVKNFWHVLQNAPADFHELASSMDYNDSRAKEYDNIEQLFSSLSFGIKFHRSKKLENITLILIMIRHLVMIIQNQLRRLEYSNVDYFTRDPEHDRKINGRRSEVKTIAYYTTLKNATYLFDELVQKDPNLPPEKDDKATNGKNCLTVVHAKYMNDPYEGLPLLNALTKSISDNQILPKNSKDSNGSPQQFREDIYDEYFIFLKSFTEKVDKLFMWNRYASDYDADGKNSNGCCIQFDPEMFNQIIGRSAGYSILNIPNGDDYYLYRMVYISDDEKINKDLNPGISDDTILYFNALKKLFYELNEEFKKLPDDAYLDKIRKEIEVSLRQSLKTLIFLFKSDDYAEEVESRLIFERRYDEAKSSIRYVSKDPYKLAINPYKQVYINKIVFGPNVRNAEEWRPYFQFELNKLWKKYSDITGDDSCPVNKRYSIEQSSIHYHT